MSSTYRRILTGILSLLLLGSVVGAAYVSVAPDAGVRDPFTEFYVVGLDGEAHEYPASLSQGEPGSVIVGIGNHENSDVTYTVVFRTENQTLATRTATVANGDSWENQMTFVLEETGRQRVDIHLYKGRETDGGPYRRLHLWVDVEVPS